MSNGLAALRAKNRGSVNSIKEKDIVQPEMNTNRGEVISSRQYSGMGVVSSEVPYTPAEIHSPNRPRNQFVEDRYDIETPQHEVYRKEPIYQEVVESYDPRYQDPRYQEPRYQESRRIPVDRVVSQTEMVLSKPDRFGLQILGLNSNDNIRIVKPRVLDVQPLVIQNIIDSTGKVAAKLEDIMHKTGATVLPLRECGVFESISSINGFSLIEYKGKRYASYCGNNYPTSYQDKLINQVATKISCALHFGVTEDDYDTNNITWNKEESRLSKMVTIGGKEIEVPSLCVSELEYVCARLRTFHCNIVEVAGDFPHLIVGLDLEGADLNEGEYSYRR